MSDAGGRLSEAQVEQFWREGCVVAEEAVGGAALAALRERLAGWLQESAAHSQAYGETLDGRPRFDLARSHRAQAPALRRVDNPPEIDAAYAEVAFESPMVDMVADLIGPDVTFHHAKINVKQPGSETRVDWHQDFSYTPHSNDHVVTALLMLDDMTERNGCLMAVPGSHREGQMSLWRGDVFTGKVDDETARAAAARARSVTGRRGSVCLMHTKLLHGSEPNTSDMPRALFICVYAAADAVPLAASLLPNRFERRVVRGRASRIARVDPGSVELPPAYRAASFFEVQEKGVA